MSEVAALLVAACITVPGHLQAPVVTVDTGQLMGIPAPKLPVVVWLHGGDPARVTLQGQSA